jgi:hypothetical protein
MFPARTTSDNMWYFNTQGHASVMACMDRTTICNPNNECFDLDALESSRSADYDKHDEKAKLLMYLYYTLLPSTIFSSLSFRQENALRATSMLSGAFSLTLDKEQWKVEARQLFETSLARIQITARDIARGNPATPDYGKINMIDSNPWLKSLCDMYIFNPRGWSNLSVVTLFSVFVAGIIFVILGQTTKDGKKLKIEGYYRALRDFHWREGFVHGLRGGVNGCKKLVSWIPRTAKAWYRSFKEWKESKRAPKAVARSSETVLQLEVLEGLTASGIDLADILSHFDGDDESNARTADGPILSIPTPATLPVR